MFKLMLLVECLPKDDVSLPGYIQGSIMLLVGRKQYLMDFCYDYMGCYRRSFLLVAVI